MLFVIIIIIIIIIINHHLRQCIVRDHNKLAALTQVISHRMFVMASAACRRFEA